MMQALEPSADERAAIEARIERGSGPIEDALAATTAALSGLSACAGLVFVPKRELVVRQFAFVALSPEQALAVIVSEDGSVENRVIDLPPGISAAVLTPAATYRIAMLSGWPLADALARTGAQRDSE